LVLFVAWLGWVFDAMDATIYAIVLHPALHELLQAGAAGGAVTDEQIGWYGGIVFSIFLIGWAIGGIGFGMAADYFGRTKTLIVTILIYAVFTGLAAFAQEWWHLAIYRFLTALGIGGEWAAGAAIVAETWPEEKRARAAGVLQSAWAAGFFLAAGFNLLLSSYGWRVLFLVGILPLTLETNDGVAATLLNIEYFGLGLDYLDRYPSIVRALTADDVRTAAQRHLDEARTVVAVAKPASGG